MNTAKDRKNYCQIVGAHYTQDAGVYNMLEYVVNWKLQTIEKYDIKKI